VVPTAAAGARGEATVLISCCASALDDGGGGGVQHSEAKVYTIIIHTDTTFERKPSSAYAVGKTREKKNCL